MDVAELKEQNASLQLQLQKAVLEAKKAGKKAAAAEAKSAAPRPSATWLQVGVDVEVIMEEPGLIGSRYPGRVLQVSAGKAEVEFPAFDEDEESGEKLKEWVECALVTPIPPPTPKDFARRVRVGELLDLWHEDGWWKVSVLSLCGGSSYITITKMEIWTHQAPPSPPTSPPRSNGWSMGAAFQGQTLT